MFFTDQSGIIRGTSKAESLLSSFRSGSFRPDLLFAGILLDGMSGIDAVRELRLSGFAGEVIFITSSPDYALAAYELGARQYFVKPVDSARLFATIEHIIDGGKGSIVVKQGRALRKILLSRIMYCETQGKYQLIHTKNGTIRARMTAEREREIEGLAHNN